MYTHTITINHYGNGCRYGVNASLEHKNFTQKDLKLQKTFLFYETLYPEGQFETIYINI